MTILTIRTDKPKAELGLFDNATQLGYEIWEAHRQLAETIHSKIEHLLTKHGENWHDIQGVVCFKGPGSFTGLRIGLTVGNALAANLHIPITGTMGDDWCERGIQQLLAGANEQVVLPHYGAEAHITKPKR